MPATGGDVLRLAGVVDRQRREMERMRAAAAVSTVVATATGLLMERLGCSAADAAGQLGVLAGATGVSLAEMAASVVGTSVAAPAGEPSAARDGMRSALATDGPELAATLAAQAGPLGVESVAIWLLAADGALELLGESGLGPAEAARWRLIPPQFDCLAQRVAHDASPIWRESGWPEPDSAPVPGPPLAPRAVLPLRERAGELLGVLELRWPASPDHARPDSPVPAPGTLTGDIKDRVSALADGCARVLATRLAHGDLVAAQPKPALFSLLDNVAGSVLVVRAIRDDGAVTDFAIDHLSPGYIDPAGRDAAEIAGLTLLEAYPVAAYPPSQTDLGLFGRALRLIEGGPPQYLPGPLAEAVPLTDFRGTKFFDGAIFTWRGFGEPGSGLTDLLDHVQRLGRLGGWEENLVAGTVRWTDSAFGIFGLAPDVSTAIKIADLHSYVIAADKAIVRRFGAALSSRGDSIPPDPPGPTRRHPGAAGGDAINTTFRIVRPDDSSIRQVRVFAEPVADASGNVVGMRGAFQDVSAHYLTQVALDATRNELADTEQRAAEEHMLALRLQRAIMPPDAHPVEVAGIEVAVRYRPVGPGHLVGGDWYDTLLLPGGEVLLVVGDVAGHGIEAVTGMIAARYSLRGLAITGKGPAALIGMLNGVLCHLTGGIVGTVICGTYDPATRTLRWARAGHLPPVLVRDGTATAMPLPGGILLGMDPDAEYEEATAGLQPGDTLLMFTDGLIERRSESIGDAVGEFVAAASIEPGADRTVAAHADRLIATVVSDTEDDACLVAVRIL